MSLRISLGLLLSLTLILLTLGVLSQSVEAADEWHIQTPHFSIGDEEIGQNKSFQKDPVVSPNGTRIAYSSREDGGANFDIWTMDLDGNNKLQITDNAWDETKPAFTPDGRYLSLSDRWGRGYLVESYGSQTLYPHRENKIWNNLSYEDTNWSYTYPLVPALLDRIYDSDHWQFDPGNWSVISQRSTGEQQHYLRFYELPPILKGYDKKEGREYPMHLFASPEELYRWNWWEVSTNQYGFAVYQEQDGTWHGCDTGCYSQPYLGYETPEWLDVQSYSPAVNEPGEQMVYLLSGYDNSSYLQIYTLELPWRQGNISAYDWDNATLTRLTNDPYQQKEPGYNEREGTIYYASKEDGGSHYDLWKMDLEGNHHEQVTYEDHNQLTPAFGPDYEQIYYASDEHGDYFFDIFRTASRPGVQLTNFKAQQSIYRVFGSEGPQGMITYLARDQDYQLQVWVSRMDGTKAIQVTDSPSMFQMGLDMFQFGSPHMNPTNTTIAVDVLYRSYDRGETESRFTQLLIQRVGPTWESRDYKTLGDFRADHWSWPQDGAWYNASRIAFDPSNSYLAYPGEFKSSQVSWERYNVPSIYYRAAGRSWADAYARFSFADISGYRYQDYVHHSPAWVNATTLYLLRANVSEVTIRGHDTSYELIRVVSTDGWRHATLEGTGLYLTGATQLTAVNRAGKPVLAWTEPELSGQSINRWKLMQAVWSVAAQDFEVNELSPVDEMWHRTDPAYLDANHLIYGSNDPRHSPYEKALKILDLDQQTIGDRPGAEAVSSIGFFHISPNGQELVFLGEELDSGDEQTGGSGDNSFRGSGPLLWFFNVTTHKITNVDLNTVQCQKCDLENGSRFSLLLAHYRTNTTLLLTLVVETWEDRGTGTPELVDLSTTEIYLFDKQANTLRPVLTTPYEELVSDVAGNLFLYATTKGNVVGSGDVWLGRYNGPGNVTHTRLTNLPYMQWSGIFGPEGPTDNTIFYASQESGDEINQIWELTRLGPSWSTRNLPTQRTFERGNYEWLAPMGDMELLLYSKELPENRDNRDIFILDLTTDQEIPVATNPDYDERISAYDPNTRTIYYVLSGDGEVTLDQIYAVSFDGDGDGTTENLDLFPSDPNEWFDNDGDGLGDNADPDDDNDLAGPDGIVGTYDDGQGRLDGEDAFKFDASEWVDSDGDGVGDNADAFDTDPAASVDTDGDGYPDEWNPGQNESDSTTGLKLDAFPTHDNEWSDTDGDGQGDNADTDDDGDGVLDSNDDFPLDDTEYLDTDGDSIGDTVDTDDDGDGFNDTEDAFPLNANEWMDSDGDGTGDNADTDDDNDGWIDSQDEFPTDPDEYLDTDGNKIGNNADPDDDGDSILDDADAFPLNENEWSDNDGDGIGDNADSDDDNDGTPDSLDAFPTAKFSWTDLDGDGMPGEIWDYNGDGFDDLSGLELDRDVDGDGYLERKGGEDTNGNGLLDEGEDFNSNGILDGQDIFPDNANEWYDTDKDGLGNNADSDDDNDGILDIDDEAPMEADKGWWDTPVFGKTSSKRVKATLTASSPILLSLIAGPISFIMIKRTRYGYYRRQMKKMTNPKELRDFYIFDMDVAMYNWKVYWKHQMKLRAYYAERMAELGGDPTIPSREIDHYRKQAPHKPLSQKTPGPDTSFPQNEYPHSKDEDDGLPELK